MVCSLHRQVAEEIVAELREGTVPWAKPWTDRDTIEIARNAASGRPYSGVNVVLLWSAAQRAGFTCNRWMTFRQAKCLAGGVRRGSRGSLVVFAKEYVPSAERARVAAGEVAVEEAERRFHLRTYYVFNLDQTVDPPEKLRQREGLLRPSCDKAEPLLEACGARVVHAPGDAFYDLDNDTVVMPRRGQFHHAEDYYATLLHELVHWTGHPDRLDRSFGDSPFDPAYVREELVAELGAAFLCSSLGIQPRTRHSDYIGFWLDQIDAEPLALFRSSSEASRATEFLTSFAE